LGGLGALFGGLSPPKPPYGDRTVSVTPQGCRRAWALVPLFFQKGSNGGRGSGVAAIWTFWISPGAAESGRTAKLGLKQYIVENILHFQKYS